MVEARPDCNDRFHVAVTESRDLRSWGPLHQVTDPGDPRSFCGPGGIVRHDGRWVLCMSSYPRPNIHEARCWTTASADLQSWQEPCTLQLKYAQTDGEENYCVLIDETEHEYVLIHAPANGIGVKRSTDLVNWYDECLYTLGQRRWPWAQGRITAGHLLEVLGVQIAVDDDPRLIDFGNARIGVPDYEWMPLWLGLCNRDASVMRAILQAYDPALRADDRLGRRIAAWTLLHDFGTDAIAELFDNSGTNRPAPSLAALQALVWPELWPA